jgi:hypothetical protein
MKVRDLTRRSGKMTAWPAQWVEWVGPGTSIVAEDGVLEGLTRLGGQLLLRINVNGKGRTASLEWDPPPAVSDVEIVLLASIGAKIQDIGDLEVPTRTGRGSPRP